MVSFYKRWNCIWWNWLNIKTPPSAIYSNIKWFGQMLTSFEMIDSSLTIEDAQRVPAAHCSDKTHLQVRTPIGAGWFGCSRWPGCTLIMSSRDFLSALTASSPLSTSLDLWPLFNWKNILYPGCILLSAWRPSTRVTGRIYSHFSTETIQMLYTCATTGYRILFSKWIVGFHLQIYCLQRSHATCYRFT